MKARLARLLHYVQPPGQTPAKKASAVALGLFIGVTPFFGFHLLLSIALGRLFRLNLLRVYIAANISMPAIAPTITLAEIQSGAWLRRGRIYTFSNMPPDVWSFAQDLLLGTIVVGIALAGIGFVTAWLIASRRRIEPTMSRLIEHTALRYLPSGVTAWKFAEGKLTGDPVYRALLSDGVLPTTGTLVDLGCGQGLSLALLATARTSPRLRLWGLESRPRVASIAREALGADATVMTGDFRQTQVPACAAVLMIDVLHLVTRDDQDRLLSRVSAVLDRDGVIVIREADAAGGWRFRSVLVGNTLVAACRGVFRPRFHFRTAAAWRDALAGLGFEVSLRAAGQGTAFANVLLYAKRPVSPLTSERVPANPNVTSIACG